MLMKKKLTSTLSQFFSPTGSKDKNVTRPIIHASPLVVFVRVDVRPSPPPFILTPSVCLTFINQAAPHSFLPRRWVTRLLLPVDET